MPEPTEEPAPTEEPTEEPAPTEEPTEDRRPRSRPTSEPSSGGSGATISPWIWVLLAIAAIVVALILARMASRRREARAWRSRAQAASSQGLALHDRVAAELAMGTAAAMSSTRWSDVESSIDRLATDVNQLAATATTEPDRSVIGDVSASLDGLRSAVMLQRSAEAGDQASRELATQTLRERTGDFNGALRVLQTTLGAQPGSATAAEPMPSTPEVDGFAGCRDRYPSSRRRSALEEGVQMTDDDIELGPIDYLVVEWPADRQPDGKAFPHLVDLVDRGLIRVLDLAFVHKEMDGSVVGINIGDLDLDGNPEIAVFEGASSGLLGDDDFGEAGGAIEPGCSAAILLYENTWAAPFATALRRGGAQLVANGRIPVNAIIAALDELESADA